MNKTKEMVFQICILLGICSIALGFNPILHKDYNESKLNNVKKIEISKSINQDKYDTFMKIVNDNKVRIEKENEIKELQKIKQISNDEANKIKADIKVSASRGGDIEYDMTFILTFYTSLSSENSSKYGGVNCKGIKLYNGMVASNYYSYGTKIALQGWGYTEVLDRGGSNFNSPNRLDVFIPRIDGETDNQYYKRVQKLGKIKVQGKIIQ